MQLVNHFCFLSIKNGRERLNLDKNSGGSDKSQVIRAA